MPIEKSKQTPTPSSRLKFVVPNLVTATSLMFGVASIFFSLSGKFYYAGWMVLVSVLLDKLDGTSARMLKASSRFGVEFDSLADLVAFGMAPASFVFATLQTSPMLEGQMVHQVLLAISCGAFVLCAALRLGRFNVEATLGGSGVYFGFPMPMAGGLLTLGLMIPMKYSPESFVYHQWSWDVSFFGDLSIPKGLFIYFWIYVFFLAYLMVSGLKVPKPQKTGSSFFDVYLIVNMLFCYLIIPLRLFPEYLWFVAFQYVVISVIYHLFWESAKQYKKRSFLDVLAIPPLMAENSDSKKD